MSKGSERRAAEELGAQIEDATRAVTRAGRRALRDIVTKQGRLPLRTRFFGAGIATAATIIGYFAKDALRKPHSD